MNKISFMAIAILSFSNITNALQLQVQPTANNQMLQFGSNQLQGGIQPLLLSTNGLLQNTGLQTTNQLQTNIYGSTIGSTSYGTSSQNLLTNNLVNNNNNLYGNNNLINTNNNSNILYSKTRNKSCQAAYTQSNGSYILDLSDTYDINLYGDSIIQDFINKAKTQNYDFVYIDLCNTELNISLLVNWLQLLKQKGIQVMLNLSNNSTINDFFIYYLDLNNIKGLNISNTNVSVNGISYLCSLLQHPNNTDSTIQFINICGINIANAKTALSTAFAQHISLWEQKNSGKKYVYYKDAIIDSYNDKNNYLITNELNYNTLGTTNNHNLTTPQSNTNNLQYSTQLPLLQQQSIPIQQNNNIQIPTLNTQTQPIQPNMLLNTQTQSIQPTNAGLIQSAGQLSIPTTLQTIPQQLVNNNNGIITGG